MNDNARIILAVAAEADDDKFIWDRVNHCDGCFYAVMHIAKNPTADPRATKHCSPHGRVFKLIDLDTETGAFTGLGKNAAASMQFFL